MLDTSQKFFDLFLRGLEANAPGIVECLSVIPVSRSCYKRKLVRTETELCGTIRYTYVGFVNFPVVKTLICRHKISRQIRKFIKRHKGEDIRIICDPLMAEGSVPAVRLGKRHGVTTVGFLTDMPDFANNFTPHGLFKALLYRLYNKKCYRALKAFDRYIFLTEAMSGFIDSRKPWMLLECIVEAEDESGAGKYDKAVPPVVMYAGKCHREFGLDLLKDAAALVKNPCVFEIYGDGNYMDELMRASAENPKLKVFGVRPLDEIMALERRASLLVNPRPSAGEFTKYSFPSKTAEYMYSGTPVLMFRLPGVPAEYDEYLYYAEEETAASIARAVDMLLEEDPVVLRERGEKAKAFIIRNKNNAEQARRVIEFLNT